MAFIHRGTTGRVRKEAFILHDIWEDLTQQTESLHGMASADQRHTTFTMLIYINNLHAMCLGLDRKCKKHFSLSKQCGNDSHIWQLPDRLERDINEASWSR